MNLNDDPMMPVMVWPWATAPAEVKAKAATSDDVDYIIVSTHLRRDEARELARKLSLCDFYENEIAPGVFQFTCTHA
jgi:hypothetical protein